MAQGDDYRATTAQQDIAFRQAQAQAEPLKRKSMLLLALSLLNCQPSKPINFTMWEIMKNVIEARRHKKCRKRKNRRRKRKRAHFAHLRGKRSGPPLAQGSSFTYLLP